MTARGPGLEYWVSPETRFYLILFSADDIIWKQLTQVRDLDQFEVNSNRILEELPNAKQVVFRIAFTDAKKLHTRFSDESSLVEVYNMNQLLVIVGGLSVAILLFFILTVLLVMRKCTDNHLKGSSRTKDFTYNKPYQTYDHTNQQPLFLIRYKASIFRMLNIHFVEMDPTRAMGHTRPLLDTKLRILCGTSHPVCTTRRRRSTHTSRPITQHTTLTTRQPLTSSAMALASTHRLT